MSIHESIFEKHSLKLDFSDKKTDLATMAYEQLKQAILFDELHVGDMLSENSIANALNMSRTPVREAFRRLRDDGLVTIIQGRGAFVKPISLEDQHDLYELRIVMECYAAKTAANNFTQKELDELKEFWQNQYEHASEGVDLVDLVAHDEVLHRMILEKSNNKQVARAMANVHTMSFRYMMHSAKGLNDPMERIRQHLEIIDLIQKKDSDNLVKTLRQHIINSERNILSLYYCE